MLEISKLLSSLNLLFCAFIYHETPLITQPSFALLWEAGVLYSRLANSVFGMNFVFYRVLKLEVLIF